MSMYVFERLSPSNLPHLITLYKNAFNLTVSLEFLKMKYDTNAFGEAYVGYLALAEDGTPAAYYGVFPIVCEYSGQHILCAQSGDTMTHQNHRGKGLFIDLATKTYQLAQDLGVKFIFGFPNENSYPGFVRKLNWKHQEDLNLYTIKITTLPLIKLTKKLDFLTPVYNLFLKLILSCYKKAPVGFDNSLSIDNDAYILHDKKFFNYKTYLTSYFITLHHKSVWLKFDGRLWIGDIEYVNKEQFIKIIKSLKKLAFFIGATNIHFHTHPKTYYDDYMSEIAQLKAKNPIGYLDLNSGLDISKVKFQSGDFDTF